MCGCGGEYRATGSRRNGNYGKRHADGRWVFFRNCRSACGVGSLRWRRMEGSAIQSKCHGCGFSYWLADDTLVAAFVDVRIVLSRFWLVQTVEKKLVVQWRYSRRRFASFCISVVSWDGIGAFGGMQKLNCKLQNLKWEVGRSVSVCLVWSDRYLRSLREPTELEI